MSKIFFNIIILFFATVALFGQTIDDINKKASYLINGKKYQEAYNQLNSLYILNSFNNQTLYLLGLSSYKLGNIDDAINYYEQLIAVDNNANRVRLDLAQCYYEKNDLEKSKELLLYVKNTNPPQNVQENIDHFLDQISQRSKTKFMAYVNIGYLYDSNVTTGPLEENSPDLLGAIYSKATDDTAFVYGANFNYTIKTDDLLYKNSIGINNTNYQRIDELDTLSGYFSSAILFQKDKIRYVLPIVLSSDKIGHENRYYSKWIDFRPKLSYKYNNRTTLSVQTLFSQKTYYKNSQRETNIFSLTPSIRYFLNASSYINSAILYNQENSKTTSYSYKQKGISISYFKAFTKYLNLYFNSSYARLDYESDLNRLDKEYNLSANISYTVSPINTHIVLSTIGTKKQSNYAIFDYERVKIGLNFIYQF
jgi:tetratricopeptide (TPR) repeat protein